MVKGYTQQEGIDYTETFSPVGKKVTLRILLSIAATNDWDCWHLDIATAFLHEKVDTDLYMKVPDGVQSEGDDFVCKLVKSLYGLKQAPRLFYDGLSKYIIRFGFTVSAADSGLFTYLRDGNHMLLTLHVDDLTLTGSSTPLCSTFITYLTKKYPVKNLGEPSLLLGMEVTRNRTAKTITLRQQNKIEDLIDTYSNLLASHRPVTTPMRPIAHNETEHDRHTPIEPKDFPFSPTEAVGKLLHIAISTRPDISYPVSYLCRHTAKPFNTTFTDIIYLLKYLQGTSDAGLILGGHLPLIVKGYSDASFACDYIGVQESNIRIKHRSMSGYLFTLGSGPISWQSQQQPSVASSTCHAEYIAAHGASQESKFIRNIFDTIFLNISGPIEICVDNKSAIAVSENDQLHKKCKSFSIKYHSIREDIQSKLIKLTYLNTKGMIADILTKALPKSRFLDIREHLQLTNGQQLQGKC